MKSATAISFPILYILLILFLVAGCNGKNNTPDAYGNFESQEVIVSAETQGRLIMFAIKEGEPCQPGSILAIVDTQQYSLKKKELMAKRYAALSQKSTIHAQVEVYKQQLATLEIEHKRIQNLLNDKAATARQLDEIEGQINLVQKQVLLTQSNLSNVDAEMLALDAAIDQVNDLISRSIIKSPIAGTVLSKYAEAGEITTTGKALLKIASLDELELKAYVSGNQLSQVVIGNEIQVAIDGPDDDLIFYPGLVSWVSPNAEFTPKSIQTRHERQSLVYAIKIRVKNDGGIKINMPGEVYFSRKMKNE